MISVSDDLSDTHNVLFAGLPSSPLSSNVFHTACKGMLGHLNVIQGQKEKINLLKTEEEEEGGGGGSTELLHLLFGCF